MGQALRRCFSPVWLIVALLLLPLWAEAASPILIEGAMKCETDLLIEN